MIDRNKFIELNTKGDFDNWEPQKLLQMQRSDVSSDLGQLGYEDEIVKFWDLSLPPFERLPFRLQKRSLTVTSSDKGMLVSRNVSGQIILWLFEKGDSYSCFEQEPEMIFEIENIGETELKFTIVEHLSMT